MPSAEGSSRGSVIFPVRAAAAAVSGEHSQNRVLVGTGPAGEVARDRPQAVTADRGCLAHADASHASGLVDPRAGLDQAEGAAHLGQVREDLP